MTRALKQEPAARTGSFHRLFEILTNLADYQCSGLTIDYDDRQPVESLVNMTELAAALGMEEVETFLKRLPALLTSRNRNAYENEELLRQRRLRDDDKVDDDRADDDGVVCDEKKRSRSRARSLGKAISRSLSRGRSLIWSGR